MSYDIAIVNGTVLDGAGNPWFRADVAIKDGRIVKVGRIQPHAAGKVIDAAGLVVCPGFIDTHSHSGLMLLAEPLEEAKVRQGITTELVGVDGLSPAPVREEDVPKLRKYLAGLDGNPDIEWGWRSVGDYLARVDERKPAVNLAVLAGNGTVRLAAVGFEDRPASRGELEKMKTLVAQAMAEGAFGISSGLIYPPSMYADTAELVELCRVAAQHDGLYVSHIRGEGDTLLEAVEEAIRIGVQSGVRVIISHHKAIGRANWGKVKETLRMIDEARGRGVDVVCDQYPYTAGSTMLTALLPPWSLGGGVESLLGRLRSPETRERLRRELAEGLPGWENFVKAVGWENITVSFCKRNKRFEGKTLTEIAKLWGKSEPDALFDLLIEEEGEASMVLFLASEEDVRYVMRHPCVMVCTDALFAGKPHPRLYGTYPRILGRYVRDEKVLRVEEAVRKMTSLPASRLGLRDRGLLAPGMWADVVCFDPERVVDRATYTEPRVPPEGIEFVLVNGELVVERGEHTGATPGRALRKPS